MKKLTEKQKKTYLENSNLCPSCKSDQIEGSSVEIDDGGAYQPMICSDCGKSWNDIYTLTDVEATE